MGESDFCVKASQRLNDLVSRAGILVIASHNPGLINKVCNRVIRMEHGTVAEDRAIAPPVPDSPALAQAAFG